MSEGNWLDTFEHESVTDDNREAFNTANSKYATEKDAIIGGFNAQKAMGSPYRIPENMEGLDDAGKADFTSKANKALGIEYATDLDGLADVNLKGGLPEDAAYDENLANAFKQFAIDNKIPKSALGPLAEFFNTASVKAQGDMIASQAVAESEKAAKFAADKQAVETALIADPDFGSKEKLDEQNVLLHRALTSNLGLNAEEANDMAEFLRDREGATNPTLRKVLLKQVAPLAAEGSSQTGDGQGGGGAQAQLSPYEAKKARWPKSPESEWGNPTDQWSDQDVHTRKALGYKEAS